ncbi:thioredoxin domain-containing protein [Vagococcus xieshaowenii]|uniref:DsbA family protein n=1 Tax=Vagococcus xieshaowenii TaxID=2562451 RepID=A0AAJ5JM85_9ENTE|nr:thioredoxin domain-containing protein [Vagococcus xieshaowenii]QCA28499.1 DsbA family protein [Vagococcus xieshaowenii]TFZ42746.1 DsbA family protein [Vagococcus xieshaowenii]
MENIQPAVTNEVGIQLGDADAPVVVKEYVNLRCPYCRQWFHDSKETYAQLIADGTVRRVIKLFNKEKFGLHYANAMHDYVPKNGTYEETVAVLEAIYDSQTEWGPMDRENSLGDVCAYAEGTLGLVKDADTQMQEAILDETTQAGIRFIPTMIIGDNVFDQKITQEAFVSLINEAK